MFIGPSQGMCVCGKELNQPMCECDDQLTGENCDCSLDTANCTDNKVLLVTMNITIIIQFYREGKYVLDLTMVNVCVVIVSVLRDALGHYVNDVGIRYHHTTLKHCCVTCLLFSQLQQCSTHRLCAQCRLARRGEANVMPSNPNNCSSACQSDTKFIPPLNSTQIKTYQIEGK